MDSFLRGLIKYYRVNSDPPTVAHELKNWYDIGLVSLKETLTIIDSVYAIVWCPSCGAHKSASNLYVNGKSLTSCPVCGKGIEIAPKCE